MKRIIIPIAAAMMAAMSYNVQAQSLTDLLKGTKAGNVVDAVTTAVGVATNTVSLPGTWVYKGAAVDLQSDNTLSSLAGTSQDQPLPVFHEKALWHSGLPCKII